MTAPPDAVAAWRSRLIVTLVAAVGLVLAVRLVQLQWVERSRLSAQASRQRTFVEPIPARPGDIVDRHGRLLATTIPRQSLYAIPSRIDDPAAFARRLAAVLQIDPEALQQRLQRHAARHFVWIRRRLSDDEADAVRRLELPAGTWGFREEYLRRYPQGRLAAHVIGLRDIDGHGRGGLEQSMDHRLKGRDGSRVLLRDARGRVVEIRDAAAVPPRHGQTLAVTLDVVVQLLVEDELDRLVAEWKPNGACAIVLDPATSEVLAMASRPAFDPNEPAAVAPDAWKDLNLVSMYEPGSTFKPFIVAWAVEHGLVHPDEPFDCEHGAWRMGRRVLHDHRPHGVLSVTDVLVKSSNIGMAKIGQRLTNRGLYEATIAFGFGTRTGIELPGELDGLVRPLKEWTSYSTGSVPMGQELAATPLQVITAHAALANGGTLTKPRLILANVGWAVPTTSGAPAGFTGTAATERGSLVTTTHPPGSLVGTSDPAESLVGTAHPAESLVGTAHPAGGPPAVVSRTVSPEVARWIVSTPMLEVVRRGTGRRAHVEGHAVFGKTGTAQKADPAAGGYSRTRHVCSFIGGAPADHPRVLVLVVVDEPTVGSDHTGGTVAAPAAGRILKQLVPHFALDSL